MWSAPASSTKRASTQTRPACELVPGRSFFFAAAHALFCRAQLALDQQTDIKDDTYGETLRLLLRCQLQAANKDRDRKMWKNARVTGEATLKFLRDAGKHSTPEYVAVLKDVASNYSNFGRAPEAIEAFREAYALERTLNLRNRDHATTTCKGLADAHIGLKEYPNALHFLTEAAAILDKECHGEPDEMYSVILMRSNKCANS